MVGSRCPALPPTSFPGNRPAGTARSRRTGMMFGTGAGRLSIGCGTEKKSATATRNAGKNLLQAAINRCRTEADANPPPSGGPGIPKSSSSLPGEGRDCQPLPASPSYSPHSRDSQTGM